MLAIVLKDNFAKLFEMRVAIVIELSRGGGALYAYSTNLPDEAEYCVLED